MSNTFAWTEHPELVEFYTQHRHQPEDLYPSERRFLPWLAQQATSVLDTGCAAGGFSNIWRHYNPHIQYTGVDISRSLIKAAQQIHPDLTFFQGDLTRDESLLLAKTDVVQALGWLNWEPEYERALQTLWQLTTRYLFFDMRLVTSPSQAIVAQQRLTYNRSWDGKTTTPYVTVDWLGLAKLLLYLQPAQILGYGYWGRPADTVVGIDASVCFAAFVLEKSGRSQDKPQSCFDLPLPGPMN
ncbi:class I SAM-dependent methyltransferase [bacterium]|nr:class I SAM-dependent methyltransferase [bacterium]